MVYDGSSIHIFGFAFGGIDRGLYYDILASGIAWIDFTYDVGVGTAPGDDDLLVTGPNGANGGVVDFLFGPSFSFFDYAGNNGFTFRFGDEDDDLGHGSHDGLSGWVQVPR